MDSASACEFPGGTNRPVVPEITASRQPDTSDAITGLAQDFSFAVLHFGDQNITAAVKAYNEVDAAAFEAFLAPNSSFPDILFSPYYCLDASPNPPCAGTTTALPDNYAAPSRHPGGVTASLADASVRFVKNSVHIRTWRAMSTTQGGEIVSSDQF